MFAMRNKILPENRNSADEYLYDTWDIAFDVTKSLRRPTISIPDHIQAKFKEYVHHEQKKMRHGLNAIKYKIDAREIVQGVLGTGRIEKVRRRLYPLPIQYHSNN